MSKKTVSATLEAPKGEINLAKVRKASLKDFIEITVSKRRKEIDGERHALAKAVLEPHLLRYAKRHQFDRIAQVARELDGLLDGFTEEIAREWYSIRQFYNNISTYGIKVRDAISKCFNNELESWYRNPHSSSKMHVFAPLGEDAAKAIQEGMIKAIELDKRRSSLRKLEDELHNVITQSKSGKEAYKQLVALHVDMSEFTAYEPALPAVVSLSEDVCILNKTC